jgi:hypothetical protein
MWLARVPLVLLFTLAACRSKPVPPAPSSRPSASASATTSALPSDAPSTAPSLAPPASRQSGDAALELEQRLAKKYRAELSRARKLQADLKLEEAAEAFVRATGTGQDMYYRAIAELAYFDMTQGKSPREEAEFELLVATQSPEYEVRGQAWFNLATLYRDHGRPEASRAALARSLSARDNAKVRSQLGTRSACTAELGPREAAVQPEFVTGWTGVCEYLGLCEGQPSPAEARKNSCVSATTAAEPPDSHGCNDDPPWLSTFNYQWYAMDQAFIAPAGTNRFLVTKTRVGGWPAPCHPLNDFVMEVEGGYVRLTQRFTALQPARGHDTPQIDPENGLCWTAPEVVSVAVHSLRSGKLLAAFSTVGDLSIEAKLDAAGQRLVLSGGSCDGFVRLDGSMKLEQ